MDVFVFPSKYEGLGIALVEAQVSGIKCVVSDKIPTEAFISRNITVVSLNDSLDSWTKCVLEPDGNIY